MWSLLVGLSVVAAASAQSGAWGQCGGIGWKGATTCVSGYTCTVNNEYYSQCIPGTAAIPGTSNPPAATTSKKSACKPKTTNNSSPPTTLQAITSSSGSSTPPAGTGTAGTGPGTTLVTGYYWVRGVEAPNFHKYLQSSPANAPGTALIDSYLTAGQFAIVDGQLVALLSPGNFLYANVVASTTTGATKLSVVFKKEKGTYGTFAWSGDALQWSVAGLTRPNSSAWLVCEGQTLWVNLGSYGYMTPTGCADQTIHYYNGQTANV